MLITTRSNLLFDSRDERCFIKLIEQDDKLYAYLKVLDKGVEPAIQKKYCGELRDFRTLKENILEIMKTGTKWSELPSR